VRRYARINLKAALGIDRILNPEHLTALEIVRYLDNPDALALARFAFGKVQLMTFTLDAKSKFAGHALRDCKLPPNVLIVVQSRGNDVSIPHGESILEAGDKLTIMGVAEALPEAQRLFHAPTNASRTS
jgi:trk system potassium uptake protein